MRMIKRMSSRMSSSEKNINSVQSQGRDNYIDSIQTLKSSVEMINRIMDNKIPDLIKVVVLLPERFGQPSYLGLPTEKDIDNVIYH